MQKGRCILIKPDSNRMSTELLLIQSHLQPRNLIMNIKMMQNVIFAVLIVKLNKE